MSYLWRPKSSLFLRQVTDLTLKIRYAHCFNGEIEESFVSFQKRHAIFLTILNLQFSSFLFANQIRRHVAIENVIRSTCWSWTGAHGVRGRRCTRTPCLLSHFYVTRLWSRFDRHPFSPACPRFSLPYETQVLRTMHREFQHASNSSHCVPETWHVRPCTTIQCMLAFRRHFFLKKLAHSNENRISPTRVSIIVRDGETNFEHQSENANRICTIEKQRDLIVTDGERFFLSSFVCVVNNARDVRITRNACCASLTATAGVEANRVSHGLERRTD